MCSETLTNTQALQCIEDLYAYKKPKQSTTQQKKKIIERASNIYKQIKEPTDVHVIAKFVKLCMDYGHIESYKLIWNDVLRIQTSIKHDNFPYELLFKCSIKSKDIHKCMQLLQWIQNANNYTLCINDSFVTKLIMQSNTIQDIQLIDALLENKSIQCPHYHYIQTALINAFGKHKHIQDAVRIFNSIPDDKKDVFYVGSMMKAYINNEYYHEALDTYQRHDTLHDDIAHCLALKACTKTHQYETGTKIFNTIKSPNIQIKTAMIDLYAAANDMLSSMDLFAACEPNELNIITINAMITGYLNNGLYLQCIELYDKIQLFGLKKNDISHYLALRACSNSKDPKLFTKGQNVHSEISHSNSIRLKTALIEFYGAFGDIQLVINVYNSMNAKDKKDIIVVGALMTAYTNNGFYYECLQVFDGLTAVRRDGTIYNLAIKACSHILHYEKGTEIHQEIELKNIMNDQIRNTLIAFYGHCGEIEEAQNMYKTIKHRDKVSLNAMMTAFIDNECYNEAMMLYDDSEKDATSHCLAIKICCAQMDKEKGRRIHQNIEQMKSSIELNNALIDFYGNICSDVNNAQNIFDSVADEEKSMVTFGTMMNVLVNNGNNERALMLYDSMKKVNHMCYKMALKACANCTDLNKGKMIHQQIQNDTVSVYKNVKIKTALIDFYGHCAQMKEAQAIFDSIHEYDVDIVAVNALMNGYCVNSLNDRCIEIFESYIGAKRIQPETATFVIVLSACGYGDYIQFGQNIHQQLKQEANEQILNHLFVQINLINMYGKFAMIDECKEIFDGIRDTEKEKEIAIWNAMIYAYGRNGYIQEVKSLFDEMRFEAELVPDRVTFGLLMNAYNHSGQIKEGIQIINDEIHKSGGVHSYDLHIISSLIDGLSRSGLLFEAYEMIRCFEIQTKTHKHAMYVSLLSGCKTHKNTLIGQYVFDQIKSKWANDEDLMHAVTILLANIYAQHNQYQVVNELRDNNMII